MECDNSRISVSSMGTILRYVCPNEGVVPKSTAVVLSTFVDQRTTADVSVISEADADGPLVMVGGPDCANANEASSAAHAAVATNAARRKTDVVTVVITHFSSRLFSSAILRTS